MLMHITAPQVACLTRSLGRLASRQQKMRSSDMTSISDNKSVSRQYNVYNVRDTQIHMRSLDMRRIRSASHNLPSCRVNG